MYRVAEHVDGLGGVQIDDRANRVLDAVRVSFPGAEIVAIHVSKKDTDGSHFDV